MDSGLLGEGVQNYRAFRYNWTGLPTEEPAIVAEKTSSGTAVYVSWNGDTETAVWRFYAVTDRFGSRSYLGEAPRRGFETKFVFHGREYAQVSAEAVSDTGHILRATQIVPLHEEVLPPVGSSFGGRSAVWGQNVLHA
jgi:hypothetical protein